MDDEVCADTLLTGEKRKKRSARFTQPVIPLSLAKVSEHWAMCLA